MNSAQFGLALCRLVYDTSACLFWGASVFLATLVPPALGQPIWARLGDARRWLSLALGIAALVPLALNGAILGDGWQDALHPDLLFDIATGTSIGWAWCAQVMGAGVLIGLNWGRSSPRIGATAWASGWLLASLAITGHAAMDQGVLGVVHRLVDVLHVLTAGAWMGALPVVLSLLPSLAKPATGQAARSALMRFSTLGHVVVALVLVTGGANLWLVVGGWPLQWHLLYQRLACIKIAVVLGMVLLALFNRYVLVPAMRHSPQASRHFHRLTVAESGLSVLAVLLVAWFGMLAPN